MTAAFTLVEIIMASIIISLVSLGLLSVFVAANKHIIHTRERMTSTELGKFFVDPLQANVRWDTWNTGGNRLNVSAAAVSFGNQTINNRNFSATYTVADGNLAGSNYDPALAGTDLRRVTTRVIWNEPSP